MEWLNRNIVYLDLFSGCAGFARGLEQAGFVFKQHYHSEIDKYASGCYQKHYPHARNLGDIKTIRGTAIERPDIITFGSPCQDISHAGKREGLKGKRSRLFYEAVRLIRTCLPRVFIFENVKGHLHSNEGKDFEAVLRAFTDLGVYDCQWQLLNTAWFLPQNRERVYLVGHLRGQGRPQVFPFSQSDVLPAERLQTQETGRKAVTPALTSNYRKGGHGAPASQCCLNIPEDNKAGFTEACSGDGITINSLKSIAQRKRVQKGRSATLTTKCNIYTPVQGGQLRRLSPLEWERLQGFEDHWTQTGILDGQEVVLSDSQRYKMLGNAVSVSVVTAIGKKLLSRNKQLGSIEAVLPKPPSVMNEFVQQLVSMLGSGQPPGKKAISKLAQQYGITDLNQIKEQTELAIVLQSRKLVQAGHPPEQTFRQIVALYERQVILSHRTSQSILLQQYSTPAPIGYLMGLFCELPRLAQDGFMAFEPSAGNGMLTIAADPGQVIVNEIDSLRRSQLRLQGFAHVWKQDATKDFAGYKHTFRAVLTNPPFGRNEYKQYCSGYPIETLEHFMAIKALDCMEPNGRAAIIIGGHHTWDKLGRLSAGKHRLFFNYLYHFYHVTDVIPIDGKKLYHRQGTGFNTRIILIAGRKEKPEGAAPLYEEQRETVVQDFSRLFTRIMSAKIRADQQQEQARATIEQRLYQVYTGLQKVHPGKLILLETPATWNVYGSGADQVSEITGKATTTIIQPSGAPISLLRFFASTLPAVIQQLKAAEVPFERQSPLKTTAQMDKEALQQQAWALQARLRQRNQLQGPEDHSRYRFVLSDYILPLLIEQQDAMIIWPVTPDGYEVYGSDALLLQQLFQCPITDTFDYEGIPVEVTEVDARLLKEITRKLSDMGFRYYTPGAPKYSFPVHRPLNYYGGKELFEIPLDQFLAKEIQLWQTCQQQKKDYMLPYAHTSVLFFNYRLSGNQYTAAVQNPYRSSRGMIATPHDLEDILKPLHRFIVSLAHANGAPIPHAVMKDYNSLPLADQARYINEQTGRETGNRLNGIPTVLQPLPQTDLMDHHITENICVMKQHTPEIPDFKALHHHHQLNGTGDQDMIYQSGSHYYSFDQTAEQLAQCLDLPLLKIQEAGNFICMLIVLTEQQAAQAIRNRLTNGKTMSVQQAATRPGSSTDQTIYKKLQPAAGLEGPYTPMSKACIVLDTEVPDSMAWETTEALKAITEAVGGDADNYVRDRLGYASRTSLCRALAAEQVDAVMMAIYNIEARSQGMIIGDQTGIGKGRTAAALIRYAHIQGKIPIFLTEKPNLFSDIYRDLQAIGSGHLKPFIINTQDSKTDIKDEQGKLLYHAPSLKEQQEAFSSNRVPEGYDCVLATYSQFNSPDKKPGKPNFLAAIAENNILILDEAHNASGASNTGSFLQRVVQRSQGVLFLSATFAKRPDNMPLYALKTAMSECNMSHESLIEAIANGGVALQEVIASQLVAEGQMIRRERSNKGIEVNYITLEDKAAEHIAIADNITTIIRDIIRFQKDYINPMISQMDKQAAEAGKQISLREGTNEAGVGNTPYFSKVFQVISQMLFSLKAEAVAERAIQRLQEGKKPLIAFSSTMGSFLEDMEDEKGFTVSDQSVINPDFSEVLRKGLRGIMRYTEKDVRGISHYHRFEPDQLSSEGMQEYFRILDHIEEITTGISLSPIDIIHQKLSDAGYRVAEVTGRKYMINLSDGLHSSRAVVQPRKRINTNDAFRMFNNNEVDVLLLNQSGSTGASAHAMATSLVPADQVKQRVMIILQPELNINTEVQKRGRINRTGQLYKPIYDYITSAIPAELRLMMMLQQKLKSLDANTSSNQKQSTTILDVPDFLNKYGDKIVRDYLMEQPEINYLLDDPLHLTGHKKDSDPEEESNGAHHTDTTQVDAAQKTSGRIAILSVAQQKEFYNSVIEKYNDYVQYLKQTGSFDLEMETMDLQAQTRKSQVIAAGHGGGSAFGEDCIQETVSARILRKPFTLPELENLLQESLKGETAEAISRDLVIEYEQTARYRLAEEMETAARPYKIQLNGINKDPVYVSLATNEEKQDYAEKRIDEINMQLQERMAVVQKKYAARQRYMERLFRFYKIGMPVNIPQSGKGAERAYQKGIFLGFQIDSRKSNPFLPSNVKLRFALAGTMKYLAIPASFDAAEQIMGASSELHLSERGSAAALWPQWIAEISTERQIRYIITGNLLLASGLVKGKLVNYTTQDGSIQKGILLPEYWEPDTVKEAYVTVPLRKALSSILSMVRGSTIQTSTAITIARDQEAYRIFVPLSRKEGGDIYLDPEILALTEEGTFNRTSDRMWARIPTGNIAAFVQRVEQLQPCTVNLKNYPYHSAENTHKESAKNRLKFKPVPAPEEESALPDMDLMILQAQALKLKLKLKLRREAA